jgi:hypothetical protein
MSEILKRRGSTFLSVIEIEIANALSWNKVRGCASK